MLRLPYRTAPYGERNSTCRAFCALFVAAALFSPAGSAKNQISTAPRVQAVRFWSFGNVTRIAVQTEGEYRLKYDQIDTPPRLYFDLTGVKAPGIIRRGVQTIPVSDPRVRQIRVAQISGTTTRIVFDLGISVEVFSSQLVNPDRLMIELRPKGTSLSAISTPRSVTRLEDTTPSEERSMVGSTPDPPVASTAAVRTTNHSAPAAPTLTASRTTVPRHSETAQHATVPPVAPAPVTVSPSSLPSASTIAEADRSFVRVFGLKLGKVVIDPGHGGHDTGTIGPNGLLEKDLVLNVALRLGRLIKTRMGAEVVYTRSDDVFIPLEDRTKIANDQKADLFISIHANSSPQPSATGVETYYFNFTSDKTGLDLATRENATASSSISDLNDLLHRAVLHTKLEESREFAQRVQASLSVMSVRMNGTSRDRGVRKAPFVVLIGATMPSILAEVGFISNPHDERLMKRADQRQKIAEALYKGVAGYASSLNHLQLARIGGK
jgi:N-acetylmuramoyl-L-alanine amidase